MTSVWRAGILIAIFAALLGAPSTVLAAPPNQLVGASVSAGTGSTSTVFVFRVGYVSSAGNAAGSVSVSVAGRTLAMARVSGGPTNGTYAASTTLPAGAWTATFRAFPAKGPKPVVTGSSVRVAPPATPLPTIAVTEPKPDPTAAANSPTVRAQNGTATPAPQRKPAPAVVPSAEPREAAPASAGDAPPASAQPALATPQGQKAAAPTPSTVAAPAGPSATPAPKGPGTVASPSGSRVSPAPGAVGPSAIETDSPLQSTAVIVVSVVVAGIGAVAWLLLLRRRRDDDHERLVAAGDAGPRTGSGTPIGDVVPDRGARRSRLDPSDDPIVAAMGLRPRKGSTPRFGARQANGRAGEPLVDPPRRRRP